MKLVVVSGCLTRRHKRTRGEAQRLRGLEAKRRGDNETKAAVLLLYWMYCICNGDERGRGRLSCDVMSDEQPNELAG